MQGKKVYQEKLFNDFQLSERVPKHNFYRRLKECLDLDFLYLLTRPYYGESGQKSIDPVVFFKLCLVGYLENIISDRGVINHCSMRLDILYFLGYDIDEELPWHSTISRTRDLYPEAIFAEVFTNILTMCVDQGMVSGHTQAIDSAPVKANASMDSLELKVPEEELEDYLHKIRHISARDKEDPLRKSKDDKASDEQQTITASQMELQAITTRNKKWAKDQDQRPGAGNKGSRYTSIRRITVLPTQARISVKPGKARKLNYLSQLSVDTTHHVITDIQAYHGDKKDNQYLQDITNRIGKRFWKLGLVWQNCVADTGYSSGENYAFLEAKGLKSFIPPHGTYKGGPDNFIYKKEEDHYLCPQGKVIPFTKEFLDYRTKTRKKEYRASKHICVDCPLKRQCLGKSAQEKKFSVTYYRAEYQRNIARVNSKQGHYMKGKRQSTVEPVFGTLKEFMGMRKINTIGLAQANKCMHLSAIAYNLKKYLKFTRDTVQSQAGVLLSRILSLKSFLRHQISGLEHNYIPKIV